MATGRTMWNRQLQSCQEFTGYLFCFVPLKKREKVSASQCFKRGRKSATEVYVTQFLTNKDYLILFNHHNICGLELNKTKRAFQLSTLYVIREQKPEGAILKVS